MNRLESEREKNNQKLGQEIGKIYKMSRSTYGSPRITAKLRSLGFTCGRKRVAYIMRKNGLFACAKKRFKGISCTNSKHSMPIAPRIFEVQSKVNFPEAPNRVWVSDSTYIGTQEGWLYLTIQLDVFTRKVVGYSITDHLKSEAVWASMRMALERQSGALRGNERLIAHSDRGSQYASEMYRGRLTRLEIVQSMSRSGNCYDNAYAETFFHSLKVELTHRTQYQTRKEAEGEIKDYIENWYNSRRLHSGLGYQAPMDYERKALAA